MNYLFIKFNLLDLSFIKNSFGLDLEVADDP